MKFTIIFLLLAFQAAARTVPPKIATRLSDLNIRNTALLYFWRPDECISCISREMTEAINWSQSEPGKVYFISKTESESANLLALMESAGYKTDPRAFIVDQLLFQLPAKKNVLVLLSRPQYEDLGHDFSSKQILLALTQKKVKELKRTGSVKLPQRKEGLYYDIQAINGKAYCFSYQAGQIVRLNDKDSTETVSLYDRIDKAAFFASLKLNHTDSVLTMNGVFNGKMPGNRFVDFTSYNRVASGGPFHYFTALIHYDHRLSEEEILETVRKAKERNTALKIKPGDEVETVRSTCVLLAFDLNFNLVSCKNINDQLGEHSSQYLQPSVISGRHVYVSTNFYPPQMKDFADSNAVFMELGLNESDDYTVTRLSAAKKPEWFMKTGLYNDFSGSYPAVCADEHWLLQQCYPAMTNIDKDYKLEMPLEAFNAFLNENKIRYDKRQNPPVYNMGMLQYGEEKIILFRLKSTGKIFGAFFDSGNNYQFTQKLDFPLDNSENYFVQSGRLTVFSDDEIDQYELILE